MNKTKQICPTCNLCIHKQVCNIPSNAFRVIEPRITMRVGGKHPLDGELCRLIANHCRYFVPEEPEEKEISA